MDIKYVVEYSTISAAGKDLWVAYEFGAVGDDPHAYGRTPTDALENFILLLKGDDHV
jgi:hypothetical protein